VGAQPGTRWRKQKVDDGAKRGVARPCKGWGGSKPIRELGGLVKEVGGDQDHAWGGGQGMSYHLRLPNQSHLGWISSWESPG
jgi:hypothetical protein